MRPTKNTPSKFIDLPAPAILEQVHLLLINRTAARKRVRNSKLLKFLPTIVHCMTRGYSMQRTCSFLEAAHQLSVHKSTLSRFVKLNPLLKRSTDFAQKSATTVVAQSQV